MSRFLAPPTFLALALSGALTAAVAIALLVVGLAGGGQAALASSTSDAGEAAVHEAGVSAGPFAYVANKSSGQVSVIDLSSETEDTAVATGGHPYWVAISADASTVAASLHHSIGVALIDGTANTLIGVVDGVGSEPEAVAVNSDGSTVYVADESGEDLYVVDVASQVVTDGPIDLSSECGEPENMVISPDDVYLYVTCAGSSVIRVATAGFGVTLIDDGLSDPHGIALNAAGTLLYYTDGSDVFEWDTGSEALTGTTFSDCEMYGGAVSPDGTRLYCQEEGGPLMIFATSDGSLLASLTVHGDAVAVRPDNSLAYVPAGNVVEVIDATALTNPRDILMSGNRGRGIAIAPPVAPEPTPTPTPTPTSVPPAAATPTPTPSVLAAEQTPTPTPVVAAAAQAPAALPVTGGEPSDDGSGALPWLAAIVGAIAMMSAGGVLLAYQRRRVR